MHGIQTNLAASLRVGAIFIATGILIAFVTGIIHPSREDPSDHARVFLEYAESGSWVALHLAQFVGYALSFVGLALLAWVVGARGAMEEVAGRIAVLLAGASIALYAVVQGIDAVALKFAVDRWAVAGSPEEAAIAFGLAEAIRWSEIGVNGTFRLLQGATYAAIAVAFLQLDRSWRILGIIGVVIATIVMMRGVAVAFTGFSPHNPVYAYSGLFASNAPPVLVLWLLAVAVFAWRASRGEQSLDQPAS
jgi:hypothetical protein